MIRLHERERALERRVQQEHPIVVGAGSHAGPVPHKHPVGARGVNHADRTPIVCKTHAEIINRTMKNYVYLQLSNFHVGHDTRVRPDVGKENQAPGTEILVADQALGRNVD